jgi:hypothetical protein
MLKKKHDLFISLIIGLTAIGWTETKYCNTVQTPSLADYSYISASVLPTITEKGELYAILAREAYGKKYKLGKLHKYDDFSGSKENEDTNIATSAAREFLEEGILAKTLGWTLGETENFIEHNNENTWAVIVYSKKPDQCSSESRDVRNVTYLTHFDNYKRKFFRNFYKARRQEEKRYNKEHARQSERTTIEKDRIAKVKWNDLKKAIVEQENSNDLVLVDALVMNPKTNRFVHEEVTLRPFLVIKLRPFFLDNPHKQGESEKIKFYND